MHTLSLRQTLHRSLAWLAPLLAFVVYGSWAYWVHRDTDSAQVSCWLVCQGKQSLRAGLAQGSYAVLSTIALRHIVLALQRRFAGRRFARTSAFTLSVAVIVLLPATLHTLLGNSQPWIAIAPGVLAGTFYIALILGGAHSEGKTSAEPNPAAGLDQKSESPVR